MTTRDRVSVLVLAIAAPALTATASVAGGGGVVLLAVAAGLVLLMATRLTIAGILAAVLLAEPLAEALKRALFLFGRDMPLAYYGVQLLPTALMAIALLTALPRLATRLPASAIWLLMLTVWIAAATVAAPLPTPWFQRLGALHQEILPALIFLPAVVVAADSTDRATLGRAATLVCVVSGAYGLWQFLAGYTSLDLAWAVGAADRSIQAGKVHAWMVGDSWEHRVFSLFPDPFTWGQALTGALVLVLLARLGGGWRTVTWGAVLIGLTLAQSRTPWLTLTITGLTWLGLGWPPLRKPGVVVGALLAGFPLTLLIGGLAYDSLFTGLPVADDPFLRRYLTVGTIEARLDAWTNLLDVLRAHPLMGLGAGTDPRYGAALPLSPELLAAHDSHNVLVKLAILGGLPAVLLFVGFAWRWTAEVFQCCDPTVQSDARLAAAFLLGSQAAGYMNAGIFLTWQYFIVLGVVAGAAAVARTPSQMVASRLDHPPSPRRIAA